MAILKNIFGNSKFFKIFFLCVLVLRFLNLGFFSGRPKEIIGLISLSAIFFIIIWVGAVYGFTNWWDEDFKWKGKKAAE